MNSSRDAGQPRREYPAQPVVGVAGVVFSDRRVLLVRRGQPPLEGAWSLPGGRLELGETMANGVRREILEETGLDVRPIEIITTLDCIIPDAAGEVQFHYILVEWLCRLEDGCDPIELCSGDDAAEARWVPLDELEGATIYNLDGPTSEVIWGGAPPAGREL